MSRKLSGLCLVALVLGPFAALAQQGNDNSLRCLMNPDDAACVDAAPAPAPGTPTPAAPGGGLDAVEGLEDLLPKRAPADHPLSGTWLLDIRNTACETDHKPPPILRRDIEAGLIEDVDSPCWHGALSILQTAMISDVWHLTVAENGRFTLARAAKGTPCNTRAFPIETRRDAAGRTLLIHKGIVERRPATLVFELTADASNTRLTGRMVYQTDADVFPFVRSDWAVSFTKTNECGM